MDKNRRSFIKKLCLSCSSALILPACSRSISFWRFFTEREAELVKSLAEQIIPADKDEGATDANVINYIDKQLVGPLKRFQDEYKSGLSALETTCKQMHNSSFLDLEWDQQTEFMSQMEARKLPEVIWPKNEQQSFFSHILDHTMQGFYGSPRHGGNRNYVSYKMMKIDYPHVIGQNRYKEEDLIKKNAAL